MTTQGIAVFTAAFLLNVDPNVTELLNITWNGLAVAGDGAFLQICKDIRSCSVMLCVRVLP